MAEIVEDTVSVCGVLSGGRNVGMPQFTSSQVVMAEGVGQGWWQLSNPSFSGLLPWPLV